MCRHVPGHWAHGHMDWTLSPALGASHYLYPWHRVSSLHVSWRVWSHDLDLTNRCVPSSLATVSGSGLGWWPIRAQGGASHWNQGKRRAGSAGRGEARWGQATAVGGDWGQPGAVGGLPAPVRVEPPAWEGGHCWAQGLRAPVLAVVRELPWGQREAVCPWVLSCLSVSLFEPHWIFCPAGYVETLEMLLCEFWLASGKKCQMILGDFSLIWIQVISLESEVKVPQSCLTLGNPMGYTVHGILQARILEWVAFPFSRGSSQSRDWTQVSCNAGIFFTSWAPREVQEYWSG